MITFIWIVAAFVIWILIGEYVNSNEIQAYQSIMKANDKHIENLEKMIEIQREMIAVYQGEHSEDIE